MSSSSWSRIIFFWFPKLCCICWRQLWFFEVAAKLAEFGFVVDDNFDVVVIAVDDDDDDDDDDNDDIFDVVVVAVGLNLLLVRAALSLD